MRRHEGSLVHACKGPSTLEVRYECMVLLTDWQKKCNTLTTRVESFDVSVCEANSGVAIRKLVLACSIAKDHSAVAIQKDLLYLAIRIRQLLQPKTKQWLLDSWSWHSKQQL